MTDGNKIVARLKFNLKIRIDSSILFSLILNFQVSVHDRSG